MLPNKKPYESSIAIAKSLEKLGLNILHIYGENKKMGILLLTDFMEKFYVVRLISK